MSQSVFRERLKDQIRHQRFCCSRVDVEFDLQPIGKPHLLNTQIQLNEAEFFSQFDFLPGGMIERMAQEIAQSDQHAYRGLVLLVANETDNVVESVEEEVWVQLHSQRIQLRLRQL